MYQNLISMSDNKRSKALAFLCGDFTVTLWLLWGQNFWHQIELFGLKILATIILGIAGGIAGLAGKDIYTWYKSRKFKK